MCYKRWCIGQCLSVGRYPGESIDASVRRRPRYAMRLVGEAGPCGGIALPGWPPIALRRSQTGGLAPGGCASSFPCVAQHETRVASRHRFSRFRSVRLDARIDRGHVFKRDHIGSLTGVAPLGREAAGSMQRLTIIDRSLPPCRTKEHGRRASRRPPRPLAHASLRGRRRPPSLCIFVLADWMIG